MRPFYSRCVWPIEQCFAKTKSESGMEYYKVRKILVDLSKQDVRCLTSLCLPFLPSQKLTRANPITGKISLMQCGYFVLGDLKKAIYIILRHQTLC